MSRYQSILVYGFALFAMFFGSGNLVFPIKIGQMAGQYWLFGFLGLFITGIILPFLGLFVVKLHNGSWSAFFAEAGSVTKLLLPLFTLSLLGPFGVVPRCITVAYGGMNYIMPNLSLELFSGAFCIAMFYFCLQDQRMLNILGKWMSPILLLTLSILIVAGILNATPLEQQQNITPTEAFYTGFITGYQTMDLFAAFFFSALTFAQIQRILPLETTLKETIKFAIKPSILGVTLLSSVYLGFVFLGASFADLLNNTNPEYMLPIIAHHITGEKSAWLIGIAMIFSCLTTAVALNNIYARYLGSLLGLIGNRFIGVLAGTTLIAFVISLFDFKGIAMFLAPALEMSYPSIIALTILSTITRNFITLKTVAFYGIMAAIIFAQIL